MHYAILAFLALTWGSSFILMKIGMEVFTASQVAAYRMVIAGFVFIPWILKYAREVKKSDLKWMFAVGMIGNGIPAFLFTHAQTYLPSSLTGALNALTPLFTLMIGVFFLGMRSTRLQVTGVVIGLAGAMMLIFLKHNGETETHTGYAALVVFATLCYGTSVNLIKTRLSHYRPLITAAFPMAFAGSVTLPVLLYSLQQSPPDTSVMGASLLAISVLGIVGTAISLIFFNRLIQMTDAVFASSVTYLIPVVAVFWGWLDKEQIGWVQLVALGTILLGIYLVNRKRSK